MAGRLDGKVAVITGAGSGIGRAIAVRFHGEGARVFAVDISGQQEVLAKELGDRCVPLHADVSRPDEVEAMIGRTVEAAGGLHILVNNAGVEGVPSPVGEIPVDEWDRVIAVDLKGVFLGMRYGIPAIVAAGGGSVINIASMAASVAFPTQAPYCAAKAGVVQLSKVAAVEYAGAGVRVNVIAPGVIATPINEKLPQEMISGVLAMTPMGRIADPAEIAGVALFLASEDSTFVTGTSIVADGGYTAL